MTTENLIKANAIYEKIKGCKENLSILNHALSKQFLERQATFDYNGTKEPVIIPPSIFKKVAKLIKDEHRKTLKELEAEFKRIGND